MWAVSANSRCPTIVAGGCVVFQEKFDPAEGFELIKDHQVSVWAGIPTMFQMALDHTSAKDADVSSIKAIYVWWFSSGCRID